MNQSQQEAAFHELEREFGEQQKAHYELSTRVALLEQRVKTLWLMLAAPVATIIGFVLNKALNAIG